MYIVQIVKLNSEATIPTRNNQHDAGMDLYALEDTFIEIGETKLIKTGVAVQIIPGYVGKIEGRSSMNLKGIITSGGVIDAGYAGDIGVVLNNFSNSSVLLGFGDKAKFAYKVSKGDKIAQLLIYKIVTPHPAEIKELWNSDRGNKGFGSSGK